jgi:hypothetical protein
MGTLKTASMLVVRTVASRVAQRVAKEEEQKAYLKVEKLGTYLVVVKVVSKAL